VAGRCVQCANDKLSAFLDGDLPSLEAQAVRAHLEGCAACARAAAEMTAMISTTRTLDRPEPPPTLWPAIAGKLDRLEAPVPLVPRRRWRTFGAGALAGAAAAAALVLALGSGRRARPPAARPPAPVAAAVDPLLEEAEAEFASAAAAYERSIEKLRGLLEAQQERWSADQRARYAERLARLDEAIARSREAAQRSPGDSAGNEQLFAAYQEKIAYLAAVVHRGGARGESTP
jgi:hypothetical protein